MSRVAVIRCNSYDSQEVYNALKRGIDLLGGLNQFINSKEKVLLKPNLLAGDDPVKCVTTHPAIFEGVIKIFQEEQYNLKYGDSPGFNSPETAVKKCGLKEVADRYNVPLAEFKTGKTVRFPEGNICKQFEIAVAVSEADAIVSLSKMKTHQLTRITGAVKNQLGCVYGFNKAGYHAKFPDAVDFSKALIDLNLLLKPKLFIMDGVTAMEGNGPRSGEPTVMNTLLISNDPIALDATFCRLIDLDCKFVPTLKFGQEWGLGFWEEDKIEIVGDSINSLKNPDFKVLRSPVKDETFRIKSTPTIRNLLLRRPVINEKKCIRCGICVEACPVAGGKAIFFKEENSTKKDKGLKRPPQYNYKECIRCYCCQEMCPEKAIKVKTPFLGKHFLYKD